MAGMYGCFKGRNSDSVAMASGPPDVAVNQEPAEAAEECSGKKKSKFQTFKKFFARKKKKEASATGGEAGLKGSQSSDNVSKTPDDNTLTRSDRDKGSGSKTSLSSKALSHDSVFVSDSSEANEALGASQDSIHGKVKSLQLQLKQAIRLGSPPSLMCVKRTEDAGAMSEDDGLPCSPPEYSTSHTNQAQTNSSLSLEGTDSEEDQLSCAASSRAVSPLVAVPGDFSQPASPFSCLDNSAAKHKLGLRHKACNKRKPASRLEIRADGDSVLEERLSTAIPEALEETEEQEMRDVGSDQLKPKEEEEGEEEEEEEEADKLHSKQTLLGDKDEEEEEEEEEGEDELDAGQDVSHSPEASFPLEQHLSEGQAADAEPLASSKPSSRSSSLGGLRVTPEPPADRREYLMDPPGVAYGTEKTRVESDSPLGEEEDGVLSNIGGEDGDKESSFLQEVLSSLKTPLTSCSLGLEADGVVLELDEGVKESEAEVEDLSEVEEKEEEEVETEEGEEVAEEEANEEGPVDHQVASSGSMPLLLGQPTQEEEVLRGTPSSHDDDDEDQEEGDSEEVVERIELHAQEEERVRGESQEPEYCIKEEESDLPIRESDKQEGEGADSEGEEEAIELEKEPEVEEEGWEKREEDEEEEKEETEGKERIEEAEEAEEEEEDNGKEVTEMVPDEIGEMVQTARPVPEADEGLDPELGEDAVLTSEQAGQVQMSTGMCDQTDSDQTFVDEREDGEERADEGIEIDQTEEKSVQEEDMETNQPDVDQNDQSDQVGVETDRLDEDPAGVEMSHRDMNCMEDQRDTEQTDVDQTEFTLPLVSPPDSPGFSETQTKEENSTSVHSPTSPTTSTTVLHINLVSPSSEKATSPLRHFFSAADTAEEVNPSSPHAAASSEQSEEGQLSPAEESAETGEEEEEQGKQSLATTEEEAQPAPKHPAALEEEAATQPSSTSDKSKARFTITPAWQRSISTGSGSTTESVIPPSPSSPPPSVTSIVSLSPSATRPGGAEVMATTKKESIVKVEPVSSVKAEVVLSPSRTRSVGSTSAKPLSTTTPAPTKPQTSTASTTEESAVVVEGNPENPFGVRLRKTAALHRYGSEEENSEPTLEPVAQPSGNKVDTPQPSSVKPSISQPISIKPALPRKPEALGDSGGKIKRMDQAASRSVSAGSDSPSWISVARQKQKIYKDSSLDETTAKKEEPERKSSLPLYVSSAACREPSKTLESTGKVSQLEITKHAAPVEKEVRRALSPPTPVPPQPAKSQSQPSPVTPKLSSQVTHASPKHLSQIPLSPPTPVPVPQRVPSCTNPPSLPKTPPSQPESAAPLTHSPPAQPSSAVTSPPFSSRPGPVPPRAPSQRGLPSPSSPPPALSQDEPPWMALAKKKAKAWSEMPQIVQ